MQSDYAFHPAIVIPVYNHEQAISTFLPDVIKTGLPILLVDDGSNHNCETILKALAKESSESVSLVRRARNGGKGAAVKTGLTWLLDKGYTHGLQLDADGQHDIADAMHFISLAKQSPQSLVMGSPQYDASIPKLRLYSRYLTHIWVWINTLSFSIEDSMCGFRVYPLVQTVPLLKDCGDRMDFDIEVAVRWFWHYNEIVSVPTKVHYPIDGVSHFLAWKDNMLISLMHTRLFFGMLRRLPLLLWRKIDG